MRRRLIAAVISSLVLAGGVVGLGGSPVDAQTAQGPPAIAAGAVRLDGGQEVPPADLDGRGIFAYVAINDHICYVLTARDIAPAALAHIHAAPRGVNGGIVVGLIAPTQGFSKDCITAVPDTTPNTMDVLTQSELAAIIADPTQFYTNVHNADFPGGAIRGQLR
jgi:CHRD domain